MPDTTTPEQAVIQAVTPEMFNAYAEWESPDLPEFPVKHAAFLGWVRIAFMAGFRSARLAQPLTEPQRLGQEGVAQSLYFDHVDQHGYPNGLPTWEELPEVWSSAMGHGKDYWRSLADATKQSPAPKDRAAIIECMALAIAKKRNPGLYDGTPEQMHRAASPHIVEHSQRVELEIAREDAQAALDAVIAQSLHHRAQALADLAEGDAELIGDT